MSDRSGHYLSKWQPKAVPGPVDPELEKDPSIVAIATRLSRNFRQLQTSQSSLMILPDETFLRILELVATLLPHPRAVRMEPVRLVISHHLFKSRTINKRFAAIGGTVFSALVQKHGLTHYQSHVLPSRLPLAELQEIAKRLHLDMADAALGVRMRLAFKPGTTLEDINVGIPCRPQKSDNVAPTLTAETFYACEDEATQQITLLNTLATPSGQRSLRRFLCSIAPVGKLTIERVGTLHCIYNDLQCGSDVSDHYDKLLSSDNEMIFDTIDTIMAVARCSSLTIMGDCIGVLVADAMTSLPVLINPCAVETLHLNDAWLDSAARYNVDWLCEVAESCPLLKHLKLLTDGNDGLEILANLLESRQWLHLQTVHLGARLGAFSNALYLALQKSKQPFLQEVQVELFCDGALEYAEEHPVELELQILASTASSCIINGKQVPPQSCGQVAGAVAIEHATPDGEPYDYKIPRAWDVCIKLSWR